MKEFLKNLKVGDKVIVGNRYGRAIRTVEKITPTGMFKVNGVLYNKDGSERGGDSWSKNFLYEATYEVMKEIKEKSIVRKAIKLMRETPRITLEQAEKIIEILSVEKEQGKQ